MSKEYDFVKSDYCTECEGCGYVYLKDPTHYEVDKEQCESCEELHRQEVRADRLLDEMKGD